MEPLDKKLTRQRFLSAFLNYLHQADLCYSVNIIQKVKKVIKMFMFSIIKNSWKKILAWDLQLYEN